MGFVGSGWARFRRYLYSAMGGPFGRLSKKYLKSLWRLQIVNIAFRLHECLGLLSKMRFPTSTKLIFKRHAARLCLERSRPIKVTPRYTSHALTLMPLLLILEDTVAELRTVAASARRAGFEEFEICERVVEARVYLERAIAGKVPLPAALFIDLDRGLDAGCEVLRFRNAHPSLKAIPAVIWTLLGHREREICKSFGAVAFVSKDDDPNVLIGELGSIIANFREGATDCCQTPLNQKDDISDARQQRGVQR